MLRLKLITNSQKGERTIEGGEFLKSAELSAASVRIILLLGLRSASCATKCVGIHQTNAATER